MTYSLRFFRLLLLLPILLLLRQPVLAQDRVVLPEMLDLAQPVPMDSAVTVGTLDNGLRYYIRTNRKPEQRAELRLVLDAGSVLEDEDQLGLAHFTEHMAFNGTAHFARQELVDYLESIGMRFGAHVNAYTSFDETVYMLTVPTDSADIVRQAFQILEDWAHNVSFEPEEVDRERGVVIEEWRLGLGAEARMRDRQFPVLFKESRYAERLPIGKPEVLESFGHEALKRFYRDWYRPDLMSVVAVGDFDPVWIEGLIRQHFEALPAAETLRPRRLFDVPDHPETLFSIVTDPEGTRSSVEIYYKQPARPLRTLADYREGMVENLYNGMLTSRLQELTTKADAPFLFAYAYQGSLIRTKEAYVLSAGVREGGIERGLEALLGEAERVARYGFVQSELDRQKKEVLRLVERNYEERDKTDSRAYAGQYVSHRLNGDPVPGIAYTYALYQRLFADISLEEVNRMAQEWLADQNRVILVNAPEKDGLAVPDEAALLAIFEAVQQQDIAPYEDNASEQPLLAEAPAPGPVVSEDRIEELDVTVWTLANGVRVLLKPTDFKQDQVSFVGYSPGGLSLAPDASYTMAATAAAVVQEGGLAGFDQITLQKLLAGQAVSVGPWMNELEEGVSGGGSPRDLETMLQLVYLYFTAPRKDEEAFVAYRSQMQGFFENRNLRPTSAFADTLQVTMGQYHPRARPWSTERFDEMDLEASFAFYRNRFADASDFTFIFVGSFDVEALLPLVETYLGSLPALGREEQWRDTGMRAPEGVVRKVVRRGVEPQSRTQMIFTGPFDWDRSERYAINSMADILEMKLREVLREDLGGTYGVGVGASTTHYPESGYRLAISFATAPERLEELTEAVFQQIDSLKTVPVTEKYLGKVREIQRRERETSLKQNGFWLSVLRFYETHGEDPRDLYQHEQRVAALSAETIQAAAMRYLNVENFVQVSLYPEETTPQNE